MFDAYPSVTSLNLCGLILVVSVEVTGVGLSDYFGRRARVEVILWVSLSECGKHRMDFGGFLKQPGVDSCAIDSSLQKIGI